MKKIVHFALVLGLLTSSFGYADQKTEERDARNASIVSGAGYFLASLLGAVSMGAPGAAKEALGAAGFITGLVGFGAHLTNLVQGGKALSTLDDHTPNPHVENRNIFEGGYWTSIASGVGMLVGLGSAVLGKVCLTEGSQSYKRASKVAAAGVGFGVISGMLAALVEGLAFVPAD